MVLSVLRIGEGASERASEQASDIKRIEMITLSKAAARMQMPLL